MSCCWRCRTLAATRSGTCAASCSGTPRARWCARPSARRSPTSTRCRCRTGLPSETITRADRLQSEAAAATLAELGCYRIWIGSESGSQRILDAMQRDVTVAEVHRAVDLAHRHGIEVGMFLMWGYEGEELEDIAATVDLVCRTNPEIFLTTVSSPIKG